MKEPILEQNKKAWNIAAKYFYGGGVLPSWGDLGEGSDNSKIIGNISGKLFLEIGCGSGHSIQYLLNNDAKKIYGIDISEEQIKFANELNKYAIEAGKVELFCSPMEEQISIPAESIDVVFSIYGIGWTRNIEKTLVNIYNYLKPGGKFIFSFENPIFARALLDNNINKFSFVGSPYEDFELLRKNWFGTSVYVKYYLPTTWIRECLKIGFKLIDYFDPKPIIENAQNSNLIDYYSKIKTDSIAPTFILSFRK